MDIGKTKRLKVDVNDVVLATQNVKVEIYDDLSDFAESQDYSFAAAEMTIEEESDLDNL